MQDFIIEVFDTWQSMSDWVKALVIVTPFAFALLRRAQTLHHVRAMARLARDQAPPPAPLPAPALAAPDLPDPPRLSDLSRIIELDRIGVGDRR